MTNKLDLPGLGKDAHVDEVQAALAGVRKSARTDEAYAEIVFNATMDTVSVTRDQIKYIGLLLWEAERLKLWEHLQYDSFEDYKKAFRASSPIHESNLFLGHRIVRDILLNRVIQKVVKDLNKQRDPEDQLDLDRVQINKLKVLWRPIAHNVLESNRDELLWLITLVEQTETQIKRALRERGYGSERKASSQNPCQSLINRVDRQWREYKKLMSERRYKDAEKLLDSELAESFGELSHAHIIRDELHESVNT